MYIFIILGFILLIVIGLLVFTLKRQETPKSTSNTQVKQSNHSEPELFPAIDSTEKDKHSHTNFETTSPASNTELKEKYIKVKQSIEKEGNKPEIKQEKQEVRANEVVFNLAQGTLLSEVLKRKI